MPRNLKLFVSDRVVGNKSVMREFGRLKLINMFCNCSYVYVIIFGMTEQSFGSGDQLPGNTSLQRDLEMVTNMTVAGVEAKKTRQVKLCSVRHALSSIFRYYTI